MALLVRARLDGLGLLSLARGGITVLPHLYTLWGAGVREPPVRFPKKGKRIRTKREADLAVDKAENAKVPERSGGKCEVVVVDYFDRVSSECWRAATQIHHMISGRGKRGRGLSALAEHKQHLCEECHLDITGDIGGKRLRRVGGVVPHWMDVYEYMPGRRTEHEG